MKLCILLSLLSAVTFANPTTQTTAPAGQKIHKEIKAGQIVAPTAAKPAVILSSDKSKVKK